MIDTERPIRNLYNRIIETFYSSNKQMQNRLSDYSQRSLINPSIAIDCERKTIKTPYVDIESKQIVLHEYYLNYLWCIIYTFINIIERGYPKSLKVSRSCMVLDNKDSSTRESNLVLGWALSLRDQASDWPWDVPKPIDRTSQALKTNLLFFYAINYLMYHEVAHLANGHIEYIEIIKKPTKELTEEERVILKTLEIEADNFAYDCLFSTEDTEEDRYHKSIAIMICNLSNLYLIKDLRILNQHKHPDIDIRISNLIYKETFEEPSFEFHRFNTFNLGVSLFLHLNKLNYIVEGLETYEDLIDHLLAVLDKEKQRISSLQ